MLCDFRDIGDTISPVETKIINSFVSFNENCKKTKL